MVQRFTAAFVIGWIRSCDHDALMNNTERVSLETTGAQADQLNVSVRLPWLFKTFNRLSL